VLEVTNNSFSPEDLFMNYSVVTPKIESSVLNITLFTFKTIHSLELYPTLYAPQFKGDKKFKLLLLRTRVDVSNIMGGPKTLFMQQPFLKALVKCIDFELKFPLAKVSKHIVGPL
jgi:hypothetical protein